MDNRAPQSSRRHCAYGAGRQTRPHLPGTYPDPRSNLGNALGSIDVVAGIGDPGYPTETIEQVALRELREEAGYELAKDGELIPLGHYFSSPGFTDERGYFFLARPVVPCPDYVRDESEYILDCRAFAISEIRRMIAENEIRDGNTLGICARLAARGFISMESR